MTITKNISGDEFILHPSGAIFWTARKMLLVADVHLGKVTHFRKNGVAVPLEAASKNFEMLNEIELFFKPDIVCFLGDLFHSDMNNEWSLFEDWVKRNPCKILLIAGNHDVIDADHYERIGVHVFDEMTLGEFLFTHHPKERERVFNLCGHVHPAVKLTGKGRQQLTLPCFYHSPHQMILPAFGQFTGKYVLTPKQNDCVYALSGDEVITVCEN